MMEGKEVEQVSSSGEEATPLPKKSRLLMRFLVDEQSESASTIAESTTGRQLEESPRPPRKSQLCKLGRQEDEEEAARAAIAATTSTGRKRSYAQTQAKLHKASAQMDLHTHFVKRYQEVYFSLVSEHATAPRRATHGSVGFDLFSTEFATILPGETKLFELGVVLEFKHVGIYATIQSRSGLACKKKITVAGSGIVDSDYNKEPIRVYLQNGNDVSFTVGCGDRIAQLIFHPCHRVKLVQSEHSLYPAQDRHPVYQTRKGGFGSTGY
jgi:dUTP pyrophosphatase